MYSIDLSQISLNEFEKMLLTSQLLPSQVGILDNLKPRMQRFKDLGYSNLKELQEVLKNKAHYQVLAEEIGTDPSYLKLLNRMVNSFVVKSYPLAKIAIFSDKEENSLAAYGIKSTKDYYEAYASLKTRETILYPQIPQEKADYAAHIIDLLRINGVGVEYAKILYAMGIKTVVDYNRTPSQKILESYKKLNKTKVSLGISDINYCRRFSEKLGSDLEN